MRFRALFAHVGRFRAESGGAGSGRDGGEWPCRAEPGRGAVHLGRCPRGCGPWLLPSAGHLALRATERIWGCGGHWGCSRNTGGIFCAAEERVGLGRIGPSPSAPAALCSEDGFTPISPSMFPLSFARRADYYNSSVIHIPILTASRGPWRHGPTLSPPSPSLLSRRTPPSRRRR